MEDSILKSTKKILGLASEYTVFDVDVVTHINFAFSTLTQLGINSVVVEDEAVKWSDLNLPETQLGMVKTYIYLKVRMAFDPPSTSFHIDAMKEQIRESEWRLNVYAEGSVPVPEEVP